MKQRYLALAAVLAVFSFTGIQGFAADDDNMVITGLMKMPLDGIAGKESNVVLFEVGPDWTIANHSHPGHIFVYMLEGSIKIEADGHDAQILSPGEVTYEIPNLHMVANNISSTAGAKFLVFTVGNIGEALTVFAE